MFSLVYIGPYLNFNPNMDVNRYKDHIKNYMVKTLKSIAKDQCHYKNDVKGKYYIHVAINSPTIVGTILKTCVRYILFFHQMKTLQKLWKMLFISSKKLFVFSRHSNFFNFFIHFYTFQIQKDKWKWNDLWCHELAWIN